MRSKIKTRSKTKVEFESLVEDKAFNDEMKLNDDPYGILEDRPADKMEAGFVKFTRLATAMAYEIADVYASELSDLQRGLVGGTEEGTTTGETDKSLASESSDNDFSYNAYSSESDEDSEDLAAERRRRRARRRQKRKEKSAKYSKEDSFDSDSDDSSTTFTMEPPRDTSNPPAKPTQHSPKKRVRKMRNLFSKGIKSVKSFSSGNTKTKSVKGAEKGYHTDGEKSYHTDGEKSNSSGLSRRFKGLSSKLSSREANSVLAAVGLDDDKDKLSSSDRHSPNEHELEEEEEDDDDAFLNESSRDIRKPSADTTDEIPESNGSSPGCFSSTMSRLDENKQQFSDLLENFVASSGIAGLSWSSLCDCKVVGGQAALTADNGVVYNHEFKDADVDDLHDASVEYTLLDTKLDAKVETKPDAKVKTKLDTKVKTKPNAKIEKKPDTKVKTKPDAKIEKKPDTKVKTKPDAKIETKPDSKIETKPDTKIKTNPSNNDASDKDAKLKTEKLEEMLKVLQMSDIKWKEAVNAPQTISTENARDDIVLAAPETKEEEEDVESHEQNDDGDNSIYSAETEKAGSSSARNVLESLLDGITTIPIHNPEAFKIVNSAPEQNNSIIPGEEEDELQPGVAPENPAADLSADKTKKPKSTITGTDTTEDTEDCRIRDEGIETPISYYGTEDFSIRDEGIETSFSFPIVGATGDKSEPEDKAQAKDADLEDSNEGRPPTREEDPTSADSSAEGNDDKPILVKNEEVREGTEFVSAAADEATAAEEPSGSISAKPIHPQDAGTSNRKESTETSSKDLSFGVLKRFSLSLKKNRVRSTKEDSKGHNPPAKTLRQESVPRKQPVDTSNKPVVMPDASQSDQGVHPEKPLECRGYNNDLFDRNGVSTLNVEVQVKPRSEEWKNPSRQDMMRTLKEFNSERIEI